MCENLADFPVAVVKYWNYMIDGCKPIQEGVLGIKQKRALGCLYLQLPKSKSHHRGTLQPTRANHLATFPGKLS